MNAYSKLRSSAPRNPARGALQLVLPLAPLVQSRRAYGVAAQVQKHLGALAEALAGKGAGSVRNARAVGEELPARWLARIVSEQLDLQNMWAASGTWLDCAAVRAAMRSAWLWISAGRLMLAAAIP